MSEHHIVQFMVIPPRAVGEVCDVAFVDRQIDDARRNGIAFDALFVGLRGAAELSLSVPRDRHFFGEGTLAGVVVPTYKGIPLLWAGGIVPVGGG